MTNSSNQFNKLFKSGRDCGVRRQGNALSTGVSHLSHVALQATIIQYATAVISVT